MAETIQDLLEVTGTVAPYTGLKAKQQRVFGGVVSRWIIAYWITALVTNLFTTGTRLHFSGIP